MKTCEHCGKETTVGTGYAESEIQAHDCFAPLENPFALAHGLPSKTANTVEPEVCEECCKNIGRGDYSILHHKDGSHSIGNPHVPCACKKCEPAAKEAWEERFRRKFVWHGKCVKADREDKDRLDGIEPGEIIDFIRAEKEASRREGYTQGFNFGRDNAWDAAVKECIAAGKELNHTKTKDERANPSHSKDEVYGCIECFEDEWYNKAISAYQQKLKELKK